MAAPSTGALPAGLTMPSPIPPLDGIVAPPLPATLPPLVPELSLGGQGTKEGSLHCARVERMWNAKAKNRRWRRKAGEDIIVGLAIKSWGL